MLLLPPKNIEISNTDVIKYCYSWNLHDLIEKIHKYPPPIPFMFDGASGVPEWLCRRIPLSPFPHDVEYWLGGTLRERLMADYRFGINSILLDNVEAWQSIALFSGVRIGGIGWLPTSWRWGFGGFDYGCKIC